MPPSQDMAEDDPHRALDIDLSLPLDEKEMSLPVAKHRETKYVF